MANIFPSMVGSYPALVGLITAQAATEFAALPSDASRRVYLYAYVYVYIYVYVCVYVCVYVYVYVYLYVCMHIYL